MKESAHPFSYYLIFCPVCEVLFLENLDISEKIVVFLSMSDNGFVILVTYF